MQLLALPDSERESSTITRPAAIDRQVEEQLRRSNYLSLRQVTCTASHGVAGLHGRLGSYYLKQVAQEIASSVEGVHHVVNRIEVVAPRPAATSPTDPGQPVRLSPSQTMSH